MNPKVPPRKTAPPLLKPIQEPKKKWNLRTRFWWAAGVVAYGWLWVWFFVSGGFTDLTEDRAAIRLLWLVINTLIGFVVLIGVVIPIIVDSLNEWLDKQDEAA